MFTQVMDAEILGLDEGGAMPAQQALAKQAPSGDEEVIPEVADAISSDFEDHILCLSGCPPFYSTNLDGSYQVS